MGYVQHNTAKMFRKSAWGVTKLGTLFLKGNKHKLPWKLNEKEINQS